MSHWIEYTVKQLLDALISSANSVIALAENSGSESAFADTIKAAQ